MKNLFYLSLVFIVACGTAPIQNENISNSQEQNNNTNQNETVVWLTTSDPISMDPHRVGDHPSWNAQAQIFEGLTYFNRNNELTPLLSESFELIEPNIWQFNLRQNIYFTDGFPFDAYSVVLSLNRLLDPQINSPVAPTLFDMISYIEEVDNYTVNVHTYFPFEPLPSHLSHMGAYIISPGAIYEENNGGVLVTDNPIGTGPFILENRIHGDRLYFTRNDNYWNGAVSFENLIFRTVPETSTRISMLETGEAHGHQGVSTNIPIYDSLPNLDYFIIVSSSIDYIGFNLKNEYLSNNYLRRAINAAIDRDAIFFVTERHSTLATSTASPVVDFAPQGLVLPQRDLEYARSLLANTPWPEGGITLNYWYNVGNAARGLVGEILQANLADIGINIEITAVEWGAYLASISAGEHDIFNLGWNVVTMDADRAFFGLYHSSNYGAAGNRFWFSNDRADYLIDRARRESNHEQRQLLYNELGELLAYELPLIPLFHGHNPFPTTGITGFFADLRSVPMFHEVVLN
ncbi:MAG: ABC transporter substrate-binding protein [Defluviitaleaceae bacterium]|nr:ABC transporter substrate-binding protein [Defluviitaleaceae bacterium]